MVLGRALEPCSIPFSYSASLCDAPPSLLPSPGSPELQCLVDRSSSMVDVEEDEVPDERREFDEFELAAPVDELEAARASCEG